MSKLENEMSDHGKELKQMKAPDQLEQRLRNRLEALPPKKPKRWKSSSLIAASILFLFFFTYQFETMAFYGKKILGFDSVLNGTLAELNDQGKGQVIDKSVTLPNGAVVTLDGVMLDANQLIVFYTIVDKSEDTETKWSNYRTSLQSFFGDVQPHSGIGKTNESNTKISNVESFKAPNPFVKNLDFYITYGNQLEQREKISFELDRSRALAYKYEQDIDQTIKTDVADYTFETIIATPTQTVVKGTVDVKQKEAWNESSFPEQYEVELLVDGETVPPQGSGLSSSLNRYTFELEYDGLSHDINDLKLTMKRAISEQSTDHAIHLQEKKSIKMEGIPLSVENVTVEENKTIVILNTPEPFTVLKAELDDGRMTAGLETVLVGSYEKTESGLEKQLILTFDEPLGKEAELHITKYVTLEDVNETIQIPVR
ncbi:DUF4179 domain-containing protein [Alkalihalobacillus sp. AL-G]|uniref:DUF4179 domain-containing protein n=1 Tax=Alkalihalobacillus sp. AL-G TaxID=2926399 RepID=UPI00272B2C5D|nr:DUF4179 domain-containing protein [Alkalihalobacillus sp. AL-G]WLD93770.1 DUF4179 domain-containing protein [Alkalihalobacillus sp. AL-G]